jgi:hypothetical protein
VAKPKGVAQLVSRNQKQLRTTRVNSPVLVIVKVSIATVARKKGMGSVASFSVKVSVVPMSPFLKLDPDVHLARLLLCELEVCHLLPQVKGLSEDLVHGLLWQLR